VLDVGAGAGAASLALVPPAASIVGVDESATMLEAFAAAADERGVRHREVRGQWPNIASSAPEADVVVCHHVFYNVADLAPFALALGGHAVRRVVTELTAVHPQTSLDPLWRRFHGLERPTGPSAEDALAVLAEAGIDAHLERFRRPPRWSGRDRAEVVAFVRRQLCLAPEREAEVDDALGAAPAIAPDEAVTLWDVRP
jgi:SAM-dependent methyltransferase